MRASKGYLLAATAVLAMGVSSCGRMSPLTAEQKAIVSDTAGGVGASQRAVPKGAQQGNQPGGAPATIRRLSTASPAFALIAGDTAAAPSTGASVPPSSIREEEMRRYLADAGNACQVDFSQMSQADMDRIKRGASSGSINEKFYLRLTGNNCPASMNLDIAIRAQATQTSGQGSLDFVFAYQVRSAEYRKFNDIDLIDIKGRFDMKGDQSGGQANGELTGKIHSQSQGDIAFKLTGKMDTSSAEVVLRLDYPSFSAELKQTMDKSGEKYFINDEEATAAEFQGLLSRATEGGVVSSDQPASSQPGGSLPSFPRR